MTENMELMKPCPFCGERGDFQFKGADIDGENWVARCLNEFCTTWPSTDYHPTPEGAIEAWNKRA